MSAEVNAEPATLHPRRLSPAASRASALEAARNILIEQGPRAITLKAVAARIGRTHANLLHHFGSAEGLQRALASWITEQVCAHIAEAVAAHPREQWDVKAIVHLVFDSFDAQGGAILSAWMVLNGHRDALNPMLAAIRQLVDELAAQDDPGVIHDEALRLVLMAVGNALIGQPLAEALDLPADRAQYLAQIAVGKAQALQARQVEEAGSLG